MPEASEVKTPTQIEVPNAFANCIIQPVNSMLEFRGDEPKEQLASGQLLVKCSKMALIPLEKYNMLLQLAKGAVNEAIEHARIAEEQSK